MLRHARLAPLLTLTLVAACTGSSKEAAKASATAAIEATEAAIRPLKFDATRYAPRQLEVLEATVLKAREKLTAGDYPGALGFVAEAKTKLQEMGASVETRKAQLAKEFKDAAGGLPERLEAVRRRLEELGAATKLPKGLDAAKLQAAREDVEKAAKGWEAATAKAAEGSLGEALAFLEATRAKLTELSGTLGVPPAKP